VSALGGNLKDFGIADIFQLIGQQRKSGVLELSSDKTRIEIQFDRGSIVCASPIGDFAGAALSDMLVRCGYAATDRIDALRRRSSASAETVKGLAVEAGFISKQEIDELEDLLSKESLFDLLHWKTGSFEFKPREVEHDRAFELMMGAEQILMDGLRMIDEWQSLAGSIPPEDTVFQRSNALASGIGQTLGLNPRISREKAERVSQLIDGRASVRRVIDLSRVGTFDAMQIIVAMHKAGRIEVVTPSRVQRRVPLPQRKRQLRGALAAVLPVVLLLAVCFLSSPYGPRTPRCARSTRLKTFEWPLANGLATGARSSSTGFLAASHWRQPVALPTIMNGAKMESCFSRQRVDPTATSQAQTERLS